MMKNLRFNLVLYFFIFFFLVISIRLFYWQIVKGEELSKDAQNQHFITFEIPSVRGKILTKDETLLVSNETAYLLYGDLRYIKNKEKTASLLSPLLAPLESSNSAKIISAKEIKRKEANLLAEFKKEELIWITLAHKINKETKQQIEKLKIPGLGFQIEEKRFYPEKSSLAYVLGIVGSDSLGQDKGYFGLEGYYDLQLRGKRGNLRLEKDALGRPIILGEQEEVKAREGRSLITTIDRYSQLMTEKHLREGIKKWGAKSGNAMIIDPQTGEILSIASFPSYDQDKYQFLDNEKFKNPIVSELFEPGSIMKPLIMAAAIEEKKVKPYTKCPTCSSPVTIGEYTIRTFNDQYHPNLTMTEVLENSDNTGMVYVGSLLGKNKLNRYLIKFGFNESTGIDLEEEEVGNIKPLDLWYPIDEATLTFGQGIAITPIQMVKAYSALANKGLMVKPYLVKKAIEENGRNLTLNKTETQKVFSRETSEIITQMMVSVTKKSPLHFPKELIPELDRYKIAAKSGTAQIPISGHYDPNKTIASVIGFAPADNPKFLVYVRLTEPSIRPWGSDTAGPIFFNIMKDLLYHFGISPS